MELDLKGLKKDTLSIKNVIKEREKIINSSSDNPIETKYVANQLANVLHPKIQHVKVADIIEECDDVKTFVLVPNIDAGTKKLAKFKPGQYVSVKLKINDGYYSRPYTISCSPKCLLDNTITITVKRRNKGVVSNYLLDEVKIDDKFDISEPAGYFTYERLRDSKNIIALAGGSGITPFISMAEAIKDGILDCKLTIIYGARSKSDIIFKERLDELSSKVTRINVVYVLSEEEKEGYETGLITKELIEKYLDNENSFFVCGTLGFYEYINDLLKEFNIPNKFIRHDAFFGRIDVRGNDLYNLTVLTSEEEFNITCRGRQTLLEAMEENGIVAPNKCHVGECGFCRSKLKSGKVKTFDNALRKADLDYEYIHPCATFPESDVVIELPY